MPMTFVAPRSRRSVDAGEAASLVSASKRPAPCAPAARGFSMIEMVIVLGIAGILIAIAMPLVDRYVEKSRVVTAVIEIGEMSKAIRTYEKANGALPASLAAVDAKYAGKVDPWGYAYQYFNLRTATGNGQARKDKRLAPLNSDFDLYSIGRDGDTAASLGNSKARDDVVRARDGGFVGLAEEFDP